MLKLLDATIQAVLDTDWPTAPPPTVAKPAFSFGVPDDKWPAKVKADNSPNLNIYLYEMRENREFRRPDWDTIALPDRTIVLAQPPAYFDCHYLLSAWSPADDTEATSPTEDEHQLLGEAMRVLMRNPDVSPAGLGIVGGGDVFQQAHVYLTVAPPETPRVLNDFWSTMKLPWRPAILLVATAPLDLLRASGPSPAMITLIERFVVNDDELSADELIQIGGWVLNAADDSPIQGALVDRLDASGNTLASATTDAQGRFTFAGLRRGTHHLRASASGKTPLARDLAIPDGPPDDHVFTLS